MAKTLRLEDISADVLTVEEFAAVMRIGRSLAYEMCLDGRVHVIRCGKRVLVPKWAVRALIGQPPAA